MPSTAILRSPNPNNLRLVVFAQALTSEGQPTGEPTQVAILDDGEEFTGEVSLNACFVVMEYSRNAAALAAARPAQDEPIPETIGSSANDRLPPAA